MATPDTHMPTPTASLVNIMPPPQLLPILHTQVGIALVATVLRARHGRIEPVERVSILPKGRSYSRTLFARGARLTCHEFFFSFLF